MDQKDPPVEGESAKLTPINEAPPQYFLDATINGRAVDIKKPISDPFIVWQMEIEPEGVRQLAYEGQPLVVIVRVGGTAAAYMHVMAPMDLSINEVIPNVTSEANGQANGEAK